ncbi:unnamed protein product, partial [Ectocarpus fasciculatus]
GAPAADGRALPPGGGVQHGRHHLQEAVREGAEGFSRPEGDALRDRALLRAEIGRVVRVPHLRRERSGGHPGDEPRVAGGRAGERRGAKPEVRAQPAPQHRREGVGHGGTRPALSLTGTPRDRPAPAVQPLRGERALERRDFGPQAAQGRQAHVFWQGW